MAHPVKRVPEGLHTVTPHLTVRDGVKLIEFYKQAFGAKEVRRSVAPDGRYGVVEDPSGHRWALASHVRDMTPEQTKQAAEAMFGDKNEG
jgi:hypothetical protein